MTAKQWADFESYWATVRHRVNFPTQSMNNAFKEVAKAAWDARGGLPPDETSEPRFKIGDEVTVRGGSTKYTVKHISANHGRRGWHRYWMTSHIEGMGSVSCGAYEDEMQPETTSAQRRSPWYWIQQMAVTEPNMPLREAVRMAFDDARPAETNARRCNCGGAKYGLGDWVHANDCPAVNGNGGI